MPRNRTQFAAQIPERTSLSPSRSLLLRRYPAQTTFVYFNLACGLRQSAVLLVNLHCVEAAACCNLTSPSQESGLLHLITVFVFVALLCSGSNSYRGPRELTTPVPRGWCRCTCHFLCEFASRICSLPHNATPATAAAPAPVAVALLLLSPRCH